MIETSPSTGSLQAISYHPPSPKSHIHLLQRSKHKHSRLTHTRLGLTQNICTEDGLGNTFLLNCFMSACIPHCSDNIAYPQRGVQNRDQRWPGGARASKGNPCATRQHSRTRKKPTQQNPPETGGVDTDIRTLLVTIRLVAVGFGGGGGGQDLLSGLIVVNEFFFVRSGHFGDQVEIGAVCHTCYL